MREFTVLSSSLETIIEAVRVQASYLPSPLVAENDFPSLHELFTDSLHLALDQVGRGADPDEFRDHVVINLIIQADAEGYTPEEIRVFLRNIADSEG
jgi:hypothetical protein